MMDRNREARRAAAMANGLPRRRHRTTTGSLRDSPEDDGPMELQETARLRDRTAKKDRDREIRDRDRDREGDRDRERDRDRDRERERLSRSKRRRGVDKYMHGSNREDCGVGDDSSEESVNDEEEEDDDGPVRYNVPTPSSNPVPMSSSSPASSTLTSHRKSYPPPTKVFRTSTAPTWKAPDEMIGVSVPRKARSASTKRSHDCWSSGGGGGVVGGEQLNRQASSSPVRSTMTAAVVGPPPAPSSIPAPMSPSSSNVSIKKKIPNCPKQKPPKSSSSCPKSSPSPSSIQDEIEIEVAEVLYGLMRQSQAPCSSKQEGLLSNDLATRDINRSTGDSKSRVSSPISAPPQNTTSSASPFTTVAPKRKWPRPYPDENPRSSPIPKPETDQPVKPEAPLPGSAVENGDLLKSNDPTPPLEPVANGVSSSDVKPMVMEESVGMVVRGAKVEEASSSSPNTESQDHHRVESASTSTKPTSTLGGEKETHREEKFEIDLMAPPPQSRGSPERGEAEYGGGGGGMNMMGEDEKAMVTDREAEGKAKGVGRANEEGDGKAVAVNVNVNSASAEPEIQIQAEPKSKAKANGAVVVGPESEPHKQPSLPPQHQHHQLNLNDQNKERNIDLQLDLEKSDRPSGVNDPKLNLHKHPPPKPSKDDALADIKPGGGQASSVPLAMSVPAGWPGGLGPMGYMAPLQGVVSMDASTMASPSMQHPHFMFSQPKPKRCATHCYIARSISAHQQMMKMNPFWPAPGSAPLYGAKPPYNLNMVPPVDLHAAATATARGTVVNSAQDNTNKAGGQPFAFFPGQPASKDKSPQPAIAPDSAQKKQQFLLPQSLPPGTPSNVLHAPAFFFPFGQQQPAAAAAARPGSGKSPSTGGSAAVSTATTTAAPMGSSSTPTPAAGPAMSFSYPNMAGNEAQFMAILGNGAYPFPIPAHVGAAPPYRGSHPQAMSFFNGSFYSSQMLHPSQLQQQQQQQSAAPSQSLQIQQQQSHQNPSLSTASSSSQKQQHLQNQQQRPQGSSANGGTGTSNQSMQNFQGAKGRTSHDMGGEDSPSTADSRNRPNLGVYGQNFAMPFHSPNFALMTPPSSLGPGVASAASGGNHGDNKKQQQQQSQQQPFPMSFASINGATTPGGALDISSMAHNHAIIQSLPEAARQNYQMMAAAAQAAQAAQQKKNNYRSPEDVKTGAGPDSSNAEEERKVMGSRASAASVGQSIAFSRDLADNSIPGSNVVDSSARSLNIVPGSSRPARSSGPNTMTNPNVSTSQQLQQQQQQMLFPKQQQFVAATVAAARNKTPATSNGSVFPDHLTSSSVMAAKFPNALPSFPPLVQSSGGAPSQSTQWKNSVRPNTTTQVSSPPIATSAASTIKNLSQQQGRPQQSHTQISFGPAPTNPKPSTPSQGQQGQNSNQAPSQPMMVGSPSTSSVSKNASGSPRTTATSASAGNKSGAQGSTLSSQQGKNSPSPSLSSQKPSILGSPHMMSTSSSVSKPQLPESMQQQPLLSKQNIQQAQLFFSNYMQQASANASTGGGYYLQRHKPDNQQQQQQGQKSQGSGVPTSSSGMLSLCTPVSLANTSTSDPAKAVAAAAAAAAAANGMKGGLPQQGIFHAAQFAQSAGGTHQLVPAGFPYVHAVPTVQVKPAEQKQPAGNDNLNACWQPEKKK